MYKFTHYIYVSTELEVFDTSKANYLIYLHVEPSTDEVRYIGKSRMGLARPIEKKNRKTSYSGRSPEHSDWLHLWSEDALMKKVVRIYANNLKELAALELEHYLIMCYDRMGHDLFNLQGTEKYAQSDIQHKHLAERNMYPVRVQAQLNAKHYFKTNDIPFNDKPLLQNLPDYQHQTHAFTHY